MAESVQHMSDLFDEMKEKQVELISTNKALVLRNKELEKKVSDLEQYSRSNNVEIRGVPSTQGEDCAAIVQMIGEVSECPVAPSDLDIVHRVPAKSGEKNIIARFLCREKKNDFLRKARRARLRANQIGFPETFKTPVFINDHLTADNKRLFGKALALKKEKGWQFLWTDNCHILARKTSDSRTYRISSDSDLHVFT